jgi:hypothetical protein
MARGVVVRNEVREAVRSELLKDPKLTGKELKDIIESNIPVSYTVRTYQILKEKETQVVDDIKKSGLDSRLTIGDLMNLQLSQNVKNRLIRLIRNRERFTKREARWMSLFNDIFTKDKDLIRFSLAYALWEIYCPLIGDKFNTGPLDDEYARKGHLNEFMHNLLTNPGTGNLLTASWFQLKGVMYASDFLEVKKQRDGAK